MRAINRKCRCLSMRGGSMCVSVRLCCLLYLSPISSVDSHYSNNKCGYYAPGCSNEAQIKAAPDTISVLKIFVLPHVFFLLCVEWGRPVSGPGVPGRSVDPFLCVRAWAALVPLCVSFVWCRCVLLRFRTLGVICNDVSVLCLLRGLVFSVSRRPCRVVTQGILWA